MHKLHVNWPYYTDIGHQEGQTSGNGFVITMSACVIVLTKSIQSTVYDLDDSGGGI